MSTAPPAKRARSDEPDGEGDAADVPMADGSSSEVPLQASEPGAPVPVHQGPRFWALVYKCIELQPDVLALSEVFQPDAFAGAFKLCGMTETSWAVRADSAPRAFVPPGPSMYLGLVSGKDAKLGTVLHGRFDQSSQGFMIAPHAEIRGATVCIASVHLKAGPPERSNELRVKQCREIDAYVTDATKTTPGADVAILVGDMNAELEEDSMQTLIKLGWTFVTPPNVKTSMSMRMTRRKGEKAESTPKMKCKAADHIAVKLLKSGCTVQPTAALGGLHKFCGWPEMACFESDHIPTGVDLNIGTADGKTTRIRVGGFNVFGYPLADEGEVVGPVAPCIAPESKGLAEELIQRAKPKTIKFDIGPLADDIVRAPWGLDPTVGTYSDLVTKCGDAIIKLRECEATKTGRTVSDIVQDSKQDWWPWNPDTKQYERAADATTGVGKSTESSSEALAVAAAATKAIAQPAEGWKHYTEDELQVLDNICAAAP